VNAGIGGMGEPWAGGSGSSQIPWRVSQRADEAAGQSADSVDRGIRRPSAHSPSVFGGHSALHRTDLPAPAMQGCSGNAGSAERARPPLVESW